MYAIIETGGKQYKVSEGDVISVEKLDQEIGAAVSFTVLAVSDGDSLTVGAPVVDGAKVNGTVTANGRSKKIKIFKYTKKGYRKRQGHRQSFTSVKIDSIKA